MQLASDDGMDPFSILFLGSIVAMLSLPFLLPVTWLKGHRGVTSVGLVGWLASVASFFYPIGNLEDEVEFGTGLSTFERLILDWFFEFQIAAAVLATGALVVVGMYVFTLAPPHSWWAQRRYPPVKFQRSVERYGGPARR